MEWFENETVGGIVDIAFLAFAFAALPGTNTRHSFTDSLSLCCSIGLRFGTYLSSNIL